MSIQQITQQEVDLILRAYDQQELARKYILATKNCIEAESEARSLRAELSQYKKFAPIGCPQCHRGCFSNDKFCPHCGTKLMKKVEQ